MQHAANVTSGDVLDWPAIDWKRVDRTVKNLRQRIFRASRDGDLRRVRSLQRRMLRWTANVLASVRRVTQVNQGKKTAGVDQVVTTTPEERGAVCRKLRQLEWHKVHPVRRVYIPKKKGKRPRGIPTIEDRCVQAMGKNALEPFWEARFEGISYGFRPGRGCHDAMEKLCRVARSNTTSPWVLDADIEGAFDHIGQTALVQAIGNVPARELIKQWRKAGDMEEDTWHATDAGGLQGGVCSPLLFNVALHGMEQALGSSDTPRGTFRGTYALVRYADDVAICCPTHAEAMEAKALLAQWLAPRGWRWSEAKIPIRHLTEGFACLGFPIRHSPAPHSARSGDKLLITPSTGSIMQSKRKLKGLWRCHVGSPTVALSNEMNPVIRGWSNYFRIGVASKVCADLDNCMYSRAQRYMKRRHPRKSGWWRTAQSWGHTIGPRQDRWVFLDKGCHATLRQCAWTKIVRHRLVPTTSSPDDPTLQDYWQQRRARTHATASRYRQLFQRQKGLCPGGHQHLDNGEETHIHHVIPKQHGGKEDLVNLRLVHRNCHHQIHSIRAPLGVRRLLEPGAR